MTKKVIQKAIDKPAVPRWEDYGTIEGRLVGWACALLLLGFVVLIGPFYIIFGEGFDKRVSEGLLKLEKWIGIKI